MATADDVLVIVLRFPASQPTLDLVSLFGQTSTWHPDTGLSHGIFFFLDLSAQNLGTPDMWS